MADLHGRKIVLQGVAHQQHVCTEDAAAAAEREGRKSGAGGEETAGGAMCGTSPLGESCPPLGHMRDAATSADRAHTADDMTFHITHIAPANTHSADRQPTLRAVNGHTAAAAMRLIASQFRIGVTALGGIDAPVERQGQVD